VAINRSQALRLVGRPTSKHGFTYIWECGADAKGAEVPDVVPYGSDDPLKTKAYYGILSIFFDADGEGHGVTYYVYTQGSDDAQTRRVWRPAATVAPAPLKH
jgi:hypothetical protein